MTQFKPHLEVRKFRIMAGGSIAFEADFHQGLNIISGENSSGKSTILDLLFFSLGGDLTEWRETSQRCTQVTTEALLNGNPVTLSREVAEKKFRPMEIFTGNFEDSLKAPKSEWKVYPYARAPQKESFSQVIFRWLGIPEVAGEAEGKITMHQILRLLYADQMTPPDQIFRLEQRDSPLIRQTVGDMICGAYDADLYDAQIRLNEAKKEFEAVRAELSSILDVLGSSGHALTLSWVDAEKRKVSEQTEGTQKEIEELESRIFSGEVDELSQDEQKEIYQELIEIQSKKAEIQKQQNVLEVEISDSGKYIESLEGKLAAINDSALTIPSLKRITFMYCPSCLAPLDDEELDHACGLCKTPFGEESAKSRILGLINDISQQIKQSKRLQEVRSEEMEKLERELGLINARWTNVNERYKLSVRTPSTDLRNKAKQLYRKIGFFEQELVNLSEKENLIQRISELSDNKAQLQAKISSLGDLIEAKHRELEKKLTMAYTNISDNTCAILRQDLDRQSTFSEADDVKFNFGDNWLSVNGERFFSASSMVYFKNSFMLSMLQAALKNSYFRACHQLSQMTMAAR